jgi:hypothetical protein
MERVACSSGLHRRPAPPARPACLASSTSLPPPLRLARPQARSLASETARRLQRRDPVAGLAPPEGLHWHLLDLGGELSAFCGDTLVRPSPAAAQKDGRAGAACKLRHHDLHEQPAAQQPSSS